MISNHRDGIAQKGVLLRHLVMPGLEEEGKLIVRWLAENVSRDLYVHVMEQYFPRAHVGKTKAGRRGLQKVGQDGEVGGTKLEDDVRYADINRAVDLGEVESVKEAAVAAGLWRFVEAAEHGGVNL